MEILLQREIAIELDLDLALMEILPMDDVEKTFVAKVVVLVDVLLLSWASS
jgi:hypothetical protein